MDSGDTYHVCPHKKWFSSFEKLDGGVDIMENDHACSMIGIGIVRIRMHDEVVCELTKVRYVPTLCKKLISLGTLDAKGFKVIMENAVLNVTKGSLVVM